jgi:hypothetical protein
MNLAGPWGYNLRSSLLQRWNNEEQALKKNSFKVEFFLRMEGILKERKILSPYYVFYFATMDHSGANLVKKLRSGKSPRKDKSRGWVMHLVNLSPKENPLVKEIPERGWAMHLDEKESLKETKPCKKSRARLAS